MPPLTPPLPGMPISDSQSPASSYSPPGAITPSTRPQTPRPAAPASRDPPGGPPPRAPPPAAPGPAARVTGAGVAPAVAERRAHHRQVVDGHLEGALPRVDVRRFVGVEVDPVIAGQQVGDAVVA